MTAADIALDLSWSLLDNIVHGLAEAIRKDGVPDAIVGITRGGMIPAVMLAHRLGVRTVQQVDARRTLSDQPHAPKLAIPTISRGGGLASLHGQNVLVVDDVVGSGDTLRAVVDLVAHPVSGPVADAVPAGVRTAVLVINTVNWSSSSPDVPWSFAGLDYVGTPSDGWVRFPWELR